ncbi:hypothetical protein BDV26DRAFT_201678 [Aspergillus bertholletiae]|uniref:Secreted protein n=1 Tax=Aspergillus bertholletiae TaxID=1226010 RepID=A0A5N7B825_9EURO|nr:hypothetical protein BDV26DRAFT_201678 [Aspergillus bertholletiae]
MPSSLCLRLLVFSFPPLFLPLNNFYSLSSTHTRPICLSSFRPSNYSLFTFHNNSGSIWLNRMVMFLDDEAGE